MRIGPGRELLEIRKTVAVRILPGVRWIERVESVGGLEGIRHSVVVVVAVACVTLAVAITVLLAWIVNCWTIIRVVHNAIAVGVHLIVGPKGIGPPPAEGAVAAGGPKIDRALRERVADLGWSRLGRTVHQERGDASHVRRCGGGAEEGAGERLIPLSQVSLV